MRQIWTGGKVRPIVVLILQGISGDVIPVGIVDIQIHFSDVIITIEVSFLLSKEPAATLMSPKDPVTRGLDVSLQKLIITYGKREQKQDMRKYFLNYNWDPDDMGTVWYNEEELMRIHHIFRHPSVRVMSSLFNRAGDVTKFDRDTHESIVAIKRKFDL